MEPVAPWCTPLASGAQMREIDRYGIERCGIPSFDLMERAGTAVARCAERLAAGGPVVVLCGKGNNGGDGFVAARQLRLAGLAVDVLTTAARGEYSGDAGLALDRLEGPPPREEAFAPPQLAASKALLEGAAVVVDGLLGTGFGGRPRPPIADAIALVNRCGKPVVAIDLPSGVDGSSGAVEGEAVKATATVTFHLPKVGHYVAPGKWHVGRLEVVDIGLPREGYERIASTEGAAGLIGPAVATALPRRDASANKFSSGRLVVVGGSADLAGAVALALRGALRAGAGYVIGCVPGAIRERVALLGGAEAMTRALPEDGAGNLVPEGVATVRELAKRGAVVVGNGVGRSEGALSFVRALLAELPLPAVVDADGLFAYNNRLSALAKRTAPTVLTPHAGELERLLGAAPGSVSSRRLAAVRKASAASGTVVLLKGDDTLIAAPDGRLAVLSAKAPALACAGSGDLLAGVVGAYLAAGADPFLAASGGAYLHARAAAYATWRRVPEGVLPTDVADALPAARRLAYRKAARAEGGRWSEFRR